LAPELDLDQNQHYQFELIDLKTGQEKKMINQRNIKGEGKRVKVEDHVWFEDRWMVASLCDE
jgi:hypothetical protein